MLLKNIKTGKQAVIDNTVITRKGTLYTLKYIDGTYRRYYEKDLNSKFIQYAKTSQIESEAKTVPKKETVQKRDNIIFVDFINKCKVS